MRAALLFLAACGSPTPTASSPHTSTSAAVADAAPPTPLAADRKDCLPSAESAAGIPDGGPAPTPRIVNGRMLEALRKSGRPAVEPTRAERERLWRPGRRYIAITAKFCVDATGRVIKVRLLRATGDPNYDDRVAREISCWTFHPLLIDGTPTAACTAHTTLVRTSPPGFSPRSAR